MDLKDNFNRKAVDIAIERGLERLWSLNANGRWKGFPTLAGESDIWVTGFVLAQIRNLSKKIGAIRKSHDYLLNARHPSGGWSYGGAVPPDADSTSWCLIALQSDTRLPNLDFEKDKLFLWSHFTDGGVSTYRSDIGIREYIHARVDQSISGWISVHTDVTIAALLADPKRENVPEILTWLIGQQTNAGFINSYWWRSPHYATTFLLRAISGYKHRLPEESAKMIMKALVREQLGSGGFALGSSTLADPFTTALALESFTHLSYLGQHRKRALCGNALLHSQMKDGSWAGDFIMRIPAPDVIDPNHVGSWTRNGGGGNSFIMDKEGLFATSMACQALDRWRQAETTDHPTDKWPVFHTHEKKPDNDSLQIKVNVS